MSLALFIACAASGCSGQDESGPASGAGVPPGVADAAIDAAVVPADGPDGGMIGDGGQADASGTADGGGSSGCGEPGTLTAPRTYETFYSTMNLGYCGLPDGDQKGSLAVEVSQSDHPSWDLVSARAALMGRTDAWRGALFPSADGFLVEQGNSGGANASPGIQTIDGSGAIRKEIRVYGTPLLVPSPAGGLIVLGPFSNVRISPPQLHEQTVWMLGSGGIPVWGPKRLTAQTDVLGGGADMNGRVLVIQDGASSHGPGAILGQWFEPDGSIGTEPFRLLGGFVPGPSTWFETSPLIEGGVAVRRMDHDSGSPLTTSEWLVQVRPRSAVPEPAPDWLRARPDTNVTPISGSRYAVLPFGKVSSPCVQGVEILLASGESCGVQQIFVDNTRACRTRDLRRGLDGTLLQMLPADFERSPLPQRPDVHTCTLRFWPAALR